MTPNKSLSNQVILGIDPGYDRIGWAVGSKLNSKLEILDLGCIQTNKKDDLFSRYQALEKELSEIIDRYTPNELAIETLFFSKNKKTALQVSEARGVIISSCVKNSLEIFEYYPNQIKLVVTGNGQADKQAVEKMVRLQLKLPREKIIDDAIDAIAIVLTHDVTRR
jgi:crossover junction endodeoxyribonuclease RuvC